MDLHSCLGTKISLQAMPIHRQSPNPELSYTYKHYNFLKTEPYHQRTESLQNTPNRNFSGSAWVSKVVIQAPLAWYDTAFSPVACPTERSAKPPSIRSPCRREEYLVVFQWYFGRSNSWLTNNQKTTTQNTWSPIKVPIYCIIQKKPRKMGLKNGASGQSRTDDQRITNPLLCHWATLA